MAVGTRSHKAMALARSFLSACPLVHRNLGFTCSWSRLVVELWEMDLQWLENMAPTLPSPVRGQEQELALCQAKSQRNLGGFGLQA